MTNATNQVVATELAAVATDNLGQGQGTMVSLVVKKKGTRRGGRVYGDAVVHVLVWTGFHYDALVERSNKKLQALWDAGNLFKTLIKEAIDQGVFDASLQDVSEAVQETKDSFLRVLASAGKEKPPVDRSIWEPLVVNGQTVLGAKVYVGDTKDIAKGTIYIDGVKLGERVLEPPSNPGNPVKSAPKTIIKDILRAKLPVGLYVRYALTTENLRSIKVGIDAAVEAKAEGILVDPVAIRSLFKIAS